MNTSPGTAGQAVVNEIASWSESELNDKVAASLMAAAAREAHQSGVCDESCVHCADLTAWMAAR